MQLEAGAWLAQRYKLLHQLFQDGPMEYWQAQWQDPAGYGGEAMLQVPLAIFLQHPERLQQWQQQQHYIHPLQHPHILRLYELGQEQEHHFLASELLQGATLYQIIQHFKARDQLVPWPLAAFAIARTCEGLQFAHTQHIPGGSPIYHGDLRPENILISQLGEVKIQHFGHIQLWGDLHEAWPIQIKRRFSYAAPERWQQSAPFTPATELFSVGVLLYELLTGEVPFAGNSIEAIQKSILAPRASSVQRQRPDAPKTLSDLCQQLLDPNPAQRLAQAGEVQQILDHLLRTTGAAITTRELRGLCEQVMPPDPANASSAFESPTDYFADDTAAPTFVAGGSGTPFGAFEPKTGGDWDPFEDDDYPDDAGESTMISPNLLLDFQRSMQEKEAGSAPSEDPLQAPPPPLLEPLSLDPLDPRSRDDLEAPLGLFSNDEPSGDIPMLDFDDPDSVIELEELNSDIIEEIDEIDDLDGFEVIEEIDEIEEIEEIDVLEDLDDIESIDELEVIEEISEINEFNEPPAPTGLPASLAPQANAYHVEEDLGEATFLQSSPLPSWRDKQDNGPPTLQGSLDPSTMSLLQEAEANRNSSDLLAQIPRAGGAVAVARPLSSDNLSAARPIRTQQVDDLFKSAETPSHQLAQAVGGARPIDPFSLDSNRGRQTDDLRPSSVQGTPMDLGSLGNLDAVGPVVPPTATQEPAKSKRIWLWLLLLPLIGGGGGTGAWFIWQQVSGPKANSVDAGTTYFPRQPAAKKRTKPRPAPRRDAGNYAGPDIQPLPLMANRTKAPSPIKRPSPIRAPQRVRPRRRRTKPRRRRRRVARAVPRRTPPTRTRPRPSPPSGESGVLILIKPACTVFVGSDIKGSSEPALRLVLSPGMYQFKCIQRRKRILHRFRVRVQAGKMFRYNRILLPGKLLLRTKPWSSITAKGIGKIGRSNAGIKLYQGTYNLTLYKQGSTVPGPGMRKTMRVTIKPGRTTTPPTYTFPVLDDE